MPVPVDATKIVTPANPKAPEMPVEMPAVEIIPPTVDAQKELSLLRRFADAAKRFFAGGMDESFLGEMEAATKAQETLAQLMTRREINRQYWDLSDSFESVMRCAFFDDEFEGDRGAAIDQAVADFGAAVRVMLAKRWSGVVASKSLFPLKPEAKSETDTCEKAEELKASANVVALESVKAGKVMSGANMERLQAAMTAMQDLMNAAAPPAVETPDVFDFEAGKAFPPGTQQAGSPVPGMSSEKPKSEAPRQQAGEEEIAMTEQAMKALAAMKSAKTDSERAAALAQMETALKGAAPVAVIPAPANPELDAIKAQLGAMNAAVEGLVDVIKALPGITAPGYAQDPTGDRFGKDMDAAEETEEEVLQGGAGSFPGPAVPALFSTPTVTTPANSPVNVGVPAQKALEIQLQALQAQVAMLAGMRPASKAEGDAAPRQNGSSWGTGGLIR